MGPDPEHHFSTAVSPPDHSPALSLSAFSNSASSHCPAQIVPSAAHHLLRAIASWSALEQLTLMNISFPSDELGLHMPPQWARASDAPLLPPLPRLRALCVGMATFQIGRAHV